MDTHSADDHRQRGSEVEFEGGDIGVASHPYHQVGQVRGHRRYLAVHAARGAGPAVNKGA
ncbi:MAG: hypothetical protein ACJ780_03245 [Solirubrobacteraceae bacterium]